MPIYVDHRLSKRLRGFLRQIMPNAAWGDSMLIGVRELVAIGAADGVWRAIGVTFQRNGRRSDDRGGGKPLFQLGVARLTFSLFQPPAVMVNHDADMVRVVEGGRTALKDRVGKVPFGGGEAPGELVELAQVFLVTGHARWQSSTDTSRRAQPAVAMAPYWRPGCH